MCNRFAYAWRWCTPTVGDRPALGPRPRRHRSVQPVRVRRAGVPWNHPVIGRAQAVRRRARRAGRRPAGCGVQRVGNRCADAPALDSGAGGGTRKRGLCSTDRIRPLGSERRVFWCAPARRTRTGRGPAHRPESAAHSGRSSDFPGQGGTGLLGIRRGRPATGDRLHVDHRRDS